MLCHPCEKRRDEEQENEDDGRHRLIKLLINGGFFQNSINFNLTLNT